MALKKFFMMDKPWYRRWWIFSIILIFIAIPFIINYAYLEGFGLKIANTAFSASDIILFYGSILTLAGSLFLGIIAVYQNKMAQKMNNKLLEIEEEKYKLQLRPFVMISNWKLEYSHKIDIILNMKEIYYDIGTSETDEIVACLVLSLTNTTNAFLTVEYNTGIVYDGNETLLTWKKAIANQQNWKLNLNPGETSTIAFYAPIDFFQSLVSKRIELKLILENRLAERYCEVIDVYILSYSKLNDDKIFIHLFNQNYRLGKFTYKNGKATLVMEE